MEKGVSSAPSPASYPGDRLGLPAEGPGAVAGYGRRIGALVIDWLLCLLVATFIATALHLGVQSKSLVTLGVFGLETWIMTSIFGTTFGKRLLGLHVARMNGGPVGLGPGLVRTLLLLLVVPALLWDRDYRGLHDRAADTVVVRM